MSLDPQFRRLGREIKELIYDYTNERCLCNAAGNGAGGNKKQGPAPLFVIPLPFDKQKHPIVLMVLFEINIPVFCNGQVP